MDRNEIIKRLKEVRAEVDRLLEALGAPAAGPPAAAQAAPRPPAAPHRQDAAGTSFLDVLDLSDTVKDVYLEILRHGDGLSMDEMRALPALAGEEGLAVIVRTLARQGHVERIEQSGVVKYRALAGARGAKKLDADIWEALK